MNHSLSAEKKQLNCLIICLSITQGIIKNFSKKYNKIRLSTSRNKTYFKEKSNAFLKENNHYAQKINTKYNTQNNKYLDNLKTKYLSFVQN